MPREPDERPPAGAEIHPPDAAGGPAADTAGETERHRARAALMGASRRLPFGPVFFMTQLRGLASDKCPDPALGLPVVELHLATGEVLDLCHVIGITPAWVALAVRETEHGGPAPNMRTEFVPFEIIARVTLRSSRTELPHLGFEHSRVPRVLDAAEQSDMTPETAIEVAAGRKDR